MSGSNWSNAGDVKGGRETVAGYFANGEDANRAIRELMDEGFRLDEVGAAFHSGSSDPRELRDSSSGRSASMATAASSEMRSPSASENSPLRSEGNQALHPEGTAANSIEASPWGIWGGTPFAGASRPGPITGSEIPSDLPRELPSDLARNESRASSHAYSSSAFETSFAGMGIPPEHARRLSRDLQRGGAVVTVKAGARAAAAESVMERNHGTIRYESAPISMETGAESGGRVDVFGEIHRVYPGNEQGEEVRERKAS